MIMTAPFYACHVFCCTNERPEGHTRGDCKSKGADKIRNYLKVRMKELNVPESRVNTAGCLDRCELGPVLVIYPEGVWYRCTTLQDAERIVQDHIIGGVPVADLMLPARENA